MGIFKVDQEISEKRDLASKLTKEADALSILTISSFLDKFKKQPITGNIHTDVSNYRSMVAEIRSQVDNTINKNAFLYDISLAINDILNTRWSKLKKYKIEDRHIDIPISSTDFSDEDGVIQHNLHELLFEGAEMIGRGRPILKTPTGKKIYVSSITIAVNKTDHYMSSLTLYSKIRSNLDSIQDLEHLKETNIDKVIKMSIIRKSLQHPKAKVFGFNADIIYSQMAKDKKETPFGAYGGMSIPPDQQPVLHPTKRSDIDDAFKAALLKKVDIRDISFRYIGSNRIAFVGIDKKIEVVL